MTATAAVTSNPRAIIPLPAQITMAVAAAAHARLIEQLAAQAGAGETVLDAAPLTDFDTSALAVLLEAGRLCRQRGARLSVVNAPAKLSQFAALYGVDGLLALKRD